MSEKIADFALKHAGTTYSRNEAGQVVSRLNWEGDVAPYGGVFGTMTVIENFSEPGTASGTATGGTCSWVAETFGADGVRLFGAAEGTWEQDPSENSYKIALEGEESNGRKTRAEGAIVLTEEGFSFEGTVFARD